MSRMPRASTHKHFQSSNFIRVLSDLALVQAFEPGVAFAENLGAWLSLDDAITLHAVHAAGSVTPLSPSGAAPKNTLAEEFTRLRTRLATLDNPMAASPPASTRTKAPSASAAEPTDAAISYDIYRRCYGAHQREMDASIRTFRVKVRAVLASTSPTLAKLAGLDAVFDRSLCERERKLFSKVPALLEKRFEHWRPAHPQAPADTAEADNLDIDMNAGPWLAHFWQEFQAVMLAELDARLEPTLGLIEALNHEMTQHP